MHPKIKELNMHLLPNPFEMFALLILLAIGSSDQQRMYRLANDQIVYIVNRSGPTLSFANISSASRNSDVQVLDKMSPALTSVANPSTLAPITSCAKKGRSYKPKAPSCLPGYTAKRG